MDEVVEKILVGLLGVDHFSALKGSAVYLVAQGDEQCAVQRKSGNPLAGSSGGKTNFRQGGIAMPIGRVNAKVRITGRKNTGLTDSTPVRWWYPCSAFLPVACGPVVLALFRLFTTARSGLSCAKDEQPTANANSMGTIRITDDRHI